MTIESPVEMRDTSSSFAIRGVAVEPDVGKLMGFTGLDVGCFDGLEEGELVGFSGLDVGGLDGLDVGELVGCAHIWTQRYVRYSSSKLEVTCPR